MTLFGRTIKILTVARWFSVSIFTWNLIYLIQAACDWYDVNVTLAKCCLPFLSVWETHRNCCLEPSTTSSHCFIPRWTLFLLALAQLSPTDHGKFKRLLMTPEKEVPHHKTKLEVILSFIHPLTWIPTDLTGTRACRAACGWRGRIRMCTRWNLVYPFPDLSHSAAPWTKKMLWWFRHRFRMSVTGLMVTCSRLSPKSPCPLLLIQ